jgi:SAM-dependent methyltransferase
MVMTLRRRIHFWLRYLRANTPWDSGITPPELRTLIEIEHLEPGNALDLGCGTGTNAIYLAQHAWHVTGIDFIPQPIRLARRRASEASVNDRVRLIVGDVTRLNQLALNESYDLALDIGCLHGLPPEGRERYAQTLTARLRPGAIFLLYAFVPANPDSFGIPVDDMERLFSPAFDLVHVDLGEDIVGTTASAWYRFQRRAN